MFFFKSDIPKIGGDDWLSGILDTASIEESLLTVIGILQKYGVLCTITCIIMFYFLYRLSKIRKNPVFAKFWLVSSWGMVVLTVVFILLPYVVLGFYG